MQKNIFITLEGGIIQNIDVSADLHDIKITVIDFDIDSALENEITFLPSGDSARVFKYPTNVMGDGDVDYFEKILNNL